MPEHAHPKRLCLAALVIALLIAGLRLAWGQRTQAKLAQTIADIQAKGEPIRHSDIGRATSKQNSRVLNVASQAVRSIARKPMPSRCTHGIIDSAS